MRRPGRALALITLIGLSLSALSGNALAGGWSPAVTVSAATTTPSGNGIIDNIQLTAFWYQCSDYDPNLGNGNQAHYMVPSPSDCATYNYGTYLGTTTPASNFAITVTVSGVGGLSNAYIVTNSSGIASTGYSSMAGGTAIVKFYPYQSTSVLASINLTVTATPVATPKPAVKTATPAPTAPAQRTTSTPTPTPAPTVVVAPGISSSPTPTPTPTAEKSSPGTLVLAASYTGAALLIIVLIVGGLYFRNRLFNKVR